MAENNEKHDEKPNSPDFDQLALNLVGWLLDRHHVPVDTQSKAQEQKAVAAQLRHIWNDRGAADLAAVDGVAHTNHAAIENAIRILDEPVSVDAIRK